MSRRRLLIGLVVILAVSAAVVVFWHYASDAFRDGIENWVTARRAEGIQANYGSLVMRGFPFRLQATLREPVLSRPVPGSGASLGRDLVWEWRGSEIAVSVQPWNLNRVDLRFPGTNQITVPFGDRGRTVFAAAGRANATLDLDRSGMPASVDLDLSDLDLLSEDGNESVAVAGMELSAVSHSFDTPTHQNATFDLSVASRGVELPKQWNPPLGSFVSLLECQASLMGMIPPGPPEQAAKSWRDEGGTIEVHRLHLEWGPLQIEAGGTLALDSNLQPIGALSAIVRGFSETIDALVAGGMVQPGDGSTAKQVLGLLAKTPKHGGPPEITVPVTLQNGWIYVGPAALAQVSPISWE
jgi:hypothetical protein